MSGSCPDCHPSHSLNHNQKCSKLGRSTLTVLFSLMFIILLSSSAMAEHVEFEWDAPEPTPGAPEPEGYMLLIRAEGEANYNENAPVWIGTTTYCRLEGLTPGKTYYMVVRAYAGEVQSGNSNEIQYTVPSQSAANTTHKANPQSKTTAKDSQTHKMTANQTKKSLMASNLR